MRLFKMLFALVMIGSSIGSVGATVNGGKRPGEYTVSPDGNVSGSRRTSSLYNQRECEYGYENCSCMGDEDWEDDGDYWFCYHDDEGNEYTAYMSFVENIYFDENGVFVVVDGERKEVIQATMVDNEVAFVFTRSRKSSVSDSFTQQDRLWPPDVVPHPHVPDEYKNPKPHPIIPPDMADVSKRSQVSKRLFYSMVHSKMDWLSDGLFNWQCPNAHWINPGCDVCPQCGFDRKKSPAMVKKPPSPTETNQPIGHSNHPITTPTINNHPIKAP